MPAVIAINGASNLLLALLGWWLWQKVSLEAAIGVVVAGYTVATGLIPPDAESRIVVSMASLSGESDRKRYPNPVVERVGVMAPGANVPATV